MSKRHAWNPTINSPQNVGWRQKSQMSQKSLYYVGFISRQWLWSLFPSGTGRHVVWLMVLTFRKTFCRHPLGRIVNFLEQNDPWYKEGRALFVVSADKWHQPFQTRKQYLTISITLVWIRVTKYCSLLWSYGMTNDPWLWTWKPTEN